MPTWLAHFSSKTHGINITVAYSCPFGSEFPSPGYYSSNRFHCLEKCVKIPINPQKKCEAGKGGSWEQLDIHDVLA